MMLRLALAVLVLSSCSENVSKQRARARELFEEREAELATARAHLELLTRYGLDTNAARGVLVKAEQAINDSRPLLEREFQRGRRREAELAVNHRKTALEADAASLWSAIDDVERSAPPLTLADELELKVLTKSADLDLQSVELITLELAGRQCRGKGLVEVVLRLPGDPDENAEAQALDNHLKLATAVGSKSPMDKVAIFDVNQAVLGADVVRNHLERYLEDVHAPLDARPRIRLERARVSRLTTILRACAGDQPNRPKK